MSVGRPGDNMGGMELGRNPGGLSHEELSLRQALEYDLVMAQNIQQALVMSGDLVQTYGSTEPKNAAFKDEPRAEENLRRAQILHSDFGAMQILQMERVRAKFKQSEIFKEAKELKLNDIRKKAE